MAENIPTPTPGAPGGTPKKAETGKVQPKKETVRISLPPKPTAAPTIKLPTLPAGGPPPPPAAPAAPAAVGVAAAPAAPAAARAPAPPAPPSGPTTLRSATPTGNQPARPAAAVAATPAPARVPAAAAPVVRPGVSGLDIGLSIAAAVVGLGAVVSMILLLQLK